MASKRKIHKYLIAQDGRIAQADFAGAPSYLEIHPEFDQALETQSSLISWITGSEDHGQAGRQLVYAFQTTNLGEALTQLDGMSDLEYQEKWKPQLLAWAEEESVDEDDDYFDSDSADTPISCALWDFEKFPPEICKALQVEWNDFFVSTSLSPEEANKICEEHNYPLKFKAGFL